ncbi:hypothetical protein BS78_01G251700 [Paspalum vaginatum]|nr:hypothetical protein BS78_01G251700 [Paspalum vaginatum]
MILQSDAMFCAMHLLGLVEQGQWHAAVSYLSRFVPVDVNLPVKSVEADVLRRFLATHMALADIVAGGRTRVENLVNACFSHDHENTVCQCHGTISLRSIILNNVLYEQQGVRASLDWELVRLKAAQIVYDLVYRTPVLRDMALLPAGPMKLHNVLPISFSPRRRSCLKKQAHRPTASDLAKLYLKKRSGLPDSSSPSQESPDELLTKSKAVNNWVADLVDKSLRAGKRQQHPLQTSAHEAGPVINPGMPAVATEGKLPSHVAIPSAPLLGTVGHQVGCVW